MIAELEAIKRLLLTEWDPIGIADVPQAADEYDRYAMRVYSMLMGGSDADAVAGYLGWVTTVMMELPADVELNRQVAAKAMAVHLAGKASRDAA